MKGWWSPGMILVFLTTVNPHFHGFILIENLHRLVWTLWDWWLGDWSKAGFTLSTVKSPTSWEAAKAVEMVNHTYHLSFISHLFSQRPDLLYVLLLEPGESKFFHFQKKLKFDHVIELLYTCARGSSQMVHLWLSVEVISGCTVPFGSRIINCFQEKAFSNLLSRLEEYKFSEGDLFFYRPPVSTLWLS